MYCKTQKFLILGVSKSGYSATNYLLSRGAICYLVEELKINSVQSAIEDLVRRGAIFLESSKADQILNEIDVLVISPGVPINHALAVKAKSLNKKIVGEFELGFLLMMPTCVAVTGTNGKTTTVSLINNILSVSGLNSKLLGNVGVPVTSKLNEINKDDVCVCEVSSFQLESISSFCPHIACLLNVSPDHLERHYTMENYFYLKKRIFNNQTISEYAVLNYDDEMIKSLKDDIKSKILWVSTREKVDGAYLENNVLYFKEKAIVNKDELNLVGIHNVSNCLFAIAVCCLLGVDERFIKKGLVEFKGVANRIELVKEKNGIKYYNDSKSTNTASTITAIKTMNTNTILILGGSEKGETYEELFREIKNSLVKHVILTGDSRFNMLKKALEFGLKNISLIPDFNIAIKSAIYLAKENESVLFSPACASFDNFSNYEERGKAFCKVLEEEID